MGDTSGGNRATRAVVETVPAAIALCPLVSEIALLLDFLTSRPTNSYRGNATLKMPEGCETYAQMLASYVVIADKVQGKGEATDKDVSFL